MTEQDQADRYSRRGGSHDVVRCCPECGDSRWYELKRNGMGRRPTHDKRYRCKICCARFDELEERCNRKGNSLQHTLLDMDADEVLETARDNSCESCGRSYQRPWATCPNCGEWINQPEQLT